MSRRRGRIQSAMDGWIETQNSKGITVLTMTDIVVARPMSVWGKGNLVCNGIWNLPLPVVISYDRDNMAWIFMFGSIGRHVLAARLVVRWEAN
jgi:hypothetical protein